MTVDRRNDFVPVFVFNADITSDTTTTGEIIDTANTRGNTFIISSPVFSDGTFTPLVEESDDAGFSGATAVPDKNLLGTEAGAALTALSALSSNLASIGFFGTKRFVRLSLVSTGTTSGARLNATLTKFTVETPSEGLSV